MLQRNSEEMWRSTGRILKVDIGPKTVFLPSICIAYHGTAHRFVKQNGRSKESILVHFFKNSWKNRTGCYQFSITTLLVCIIAMVVSRWYMSAWLFTLPDTWVGHKSRKKLRFARLPADATCGYWKILGHVSLWTMLQMSFVGRELGRPWALICTFFFAE